MTANERLCRAGLMEVFDAAAKARDRAELIRLLTQVDVEDPEWSADTILHSTEQVPAFL
jgi:hypothetical protein